VQHDSGTEGVYGRGKQADPFTVKFLPYQENEQNGYSAHKYGEHPTGKKIVTKDLFKN